jgi:precorrin-2 dehydrogenase/sirohydrochlorin ferrochelatase
MFPLFLNLTDRLAVVVGGGVVGQRKAAALLAAGALVRVVALEARPAIDSAIDWITAPYRPGHLTGAALVLACGPADLNQQIVGDAWAAGIWCNCADPPDEGNCFLPATVRQGDLVIAIGTGGAAPALARNIRQRLERTFDPAFGQWVALLAELRPWVLAEVSDPALRRRIFEDLSRWRWLKRLRREGVESVREAMQKRARTLADGRSRGV